MPQTLKPLMLGIKMRVKMGWYTYTEFKYTISRYDFISVVWLGDWKEKKKNVGRTFVKSPLEFISILFKVAYGQLW